MILIYLHGAPGVGKLTIATELAQLIPARVVDNHLTIDVARAVFDFGAPGFWPLVKSLREQVIMAAARSDLPYLITTSSYSHPNDLPAFETAERLVTGNDGDVAPFYLTCSMEVLEARIGRQDRLDRGKLSSAAGLRTFLSNHNIGPVPRPNCKTVNTSDTAARETAMQIVQMLEEAR